MKHEMKPFSLPDEILHLLVLKALGKLTDVESNELIHWQKQNPDKQLECEDFCRQVVRYHWLYQSLGFAQPEMIVEKITGRRTKSLLLRLLPYAATLLIMAGLAFYFLNKSTETDVTTVQYESLPVERHNRAMLVLSDGNSLLLDQPESMQMADESGVRITNKPGEWLRYEQADRPSAEQRMNRLIVPAGARYQLQLADGSKVWVNSRSELEYPVSFASGERRVKLSGEAYFEVQASETTPFIIEANGYEVKVLGTSFNISAYSEDAFIQATLVKGAVELNSRKGSAVKLNPGQMAMITHNDQEVKLENVDTRLFTSWREGILHFNKTSLKELATKLERWYDVEIHFTDKQKEKLLFSGAMENSRDIGFLLRLIGDAARVEFEINGNQITVK